MTDRAEITVPILILSHAGIKDTVLMNGLATIAGPNLILGSEELLLACALCWQAAQQSHDRAITSTGSEGTDTLHAFYGAEQITAPRLAAELEGIVRDFHGLAAGVGQPVHLFTASLEDTQAMLALVAFLQESQPDSCILFVQDDRPRAVNRHAEALGQSLERSREQLRRRSQSVETLREACGERFWLFDRRAEKDVALLEEFQDLLLTSGVR